MGTPRPAYSQNYYLDRESWPDFRAEAGALLALACPTSGARVLELGCGGGELLRRLERVARLAVGVELAPAALRLAGGESDEGLPSLHRTRVLGGRAESLPFAAGAFDAVVAQHLLEHLADPVAALEEWRRVLRPGGVVAIVTPNAAYPDPSLFHDPSHLHLFTRAELQSTLESAGLRVTHLSSLFPYLGRHRLARAASIRLAPLACHLPGLASRGRSLVAAARRTSDD